MFMQSKDIKLGFFAWTGRDDGATFVMDIEHQFGCFFQTVAKEFLKNEGDI